MGSLRSEQQEEDQEDLWNDPDILNNHEKLMRLKWTEKDLEMAKSTDLVEQMDIVRELVLQDCRFAEMLHQSQGKNAADAKLAVDTIDNIVEVIENLQQKCLKEITETRNKPFWETKAKEDLLKEDNQDKVKRWIQTVELFTKTFEKAQTLRMSRKSMMPSVEMDPEAAKIVQQLSDIYKELSIVSKFFDDSKIVELK